MFEAETYDAIMKRMLVAVPTDVDKREGSVIWDALAPCAAELSLAYQFLDTVMRETFADTASREGLVKRAKERGIIPNGATKAMLQGVFTPASVDVMDKRFSAGIFCYTVTAKVSDGVYKLLCDTPGSAGNIIEDTLVPVEYIPGLTSARAEKILIPGEDAEETEHLRARYFASLQAEAYGGNVADYKQKVNAIPGVGGVKVYPVWQGGGTVKLTVITSEFASPTSEFLDVVQETIDPIQNQGKGYGVAPIGHSVTVIGVIKKPIAIGLTLTYQNGWEWADIKMQVQEVLDAYFLELSEKWEKSEALIVRISQIESRLLELSGIVDIMETTINGEKGNLALQADEIPIRGDVIG